MERPPGEQARALLLLFTEASEVYIALAGKWRELREHIEVLHDLWPRNEGATESE